LASSDTFCPLTAVPIMPTAAVIDIGSNSIKVLIAQRIENGGLVALKAKTLDARISAGISHDSPRLSEEGMARGVAAVTELLSDAAGFSPDKVILVATSAVRDAVNGSEFKDRILAASGCSVRILTGEEEANLIGRGLTCDPTLAGLRDFYVFDLGGGSLECLAFQNRQITQATSLPLGCVRLTERYVSNTAIPFSLDVRRRIDEFTKETIAKSGFRFNLPPEAIAVGTGGTVTTVRAILAERIGRTFNESDSLITLEQLRELLNSTGRWTLEDRRRVPGLPPARADVFPTALATVIAVAEMGGLHAYRNSIYNLRWGIADEALS
jgi:exopolyphosphatase / guanosine-5'-triphosphate,3'-diphosphate pyrophosphatase